MDSSFWYALSAPDDLHHTQARELFARHEPSGLITSERVLEELWTLLRRRKGHKTAVRVLDGLQTSKRLRRHAIDDATASAAWEWLRRHDEREYSYADASSFALMRRLRLTEALAFDGDFSAAGFIELRGAGG